MKKKMLVALAVTALLCISTVFADDISSSDKLKYIGIISGDEHGNLNLDSNITRAEMMKIIFKLDPDAKEENYVHRNSFHDVKSWDWFVPYVEYAYENKISIGTAVNIFSPNDNLSSGQAVTFLIRRLDYGTVSIAEALEIAKGIGIDSSLIGDSEAPIARGNLFIMLEQGLDAKLNTTETTLAEDSGYADVIAEYNRITGVADADQEIAKIQLLTGNKILLDLEKNNIGYTKENFKVLKSGSEKTVSVLAVEAVEEKQIVLELEKLTAGNKYEIDFNGKTHRFTGIPEDDRIFTYVPYETRVIDNKTVKIMFNKAVDLTKLPQPEDFTLSSGNVTAIEKYVDSKGYLYHNVLLVKTDTQKYGELYILEINNVTSLNGDEIETSEEYNVYRYGGRKVDNDEPVVKDIERRINKKITINFTETLDLDDTTALDPNNYTITNTDNEKIQEIESIQFVDEEIGKKRSVVIYFKEKLIEEKLHLLEIFNVSDTDGNSISSTIPSKHNFYSATDDTFGPKIKIIEPKDLNNIVVYFDEDIQPLEADDYKKIIISSEGVEAVSAERDETDFSVLNVSTTDQPLATTIKIEFPDMIYDEMGNVTRKGYYDGRFDTVYTNRGVLEVDLFEPSYYGNKAFIDIRYTSIPVLEEALNPFNYELNELGYALHVDQIDDYEYRITIKNQEQYKKYTLEIENVHDLSGNEVSSIENDGEFYGLSLFSD